MDQATSWTYSIHENNYVKMTFQDQNYFYSDYILSILSSSILHILPVINYICRMKLLSIL